MSTEASGGHRIHLPGPGRWGGSTGCEPRTAGRRVGLGLAHASRGLSAPFAAPYTGARVSLNSPFYCWVNRGLLHRGPGTCPRPHGTAARGRHRAQTHGSLELCSQALKHRSPETTPTPEGGRQCPGQLTPRSLRASQPPPHTMHTSRQPGSGRVQVSSDSTSNSPPRAYFLPYVLPSSKKHPRSAEGSNRV